MGDEEFQPVNRVVCMVFAYVKREVIKPLQSVRTVTGPGLFGDCTGPAVRVIPLHPLGESAGILAQTSWPRPEAGQTTVVFSHACST